MNISRVCGWIAATSMFLLLLSACRPLTPAADALPQTPVTASATAVPHFVSTVAAPKDDTPVLARALAATAEPAPSPTPMPQPSAAPTGRAPYLHPDCQSHAKRALHGAPAG